MDSKGNAKICDFGICCKLALDETTESDCEGDFFRSPEMLNGPYNHSVDFWSLGINVFYMMTQYFPFQEDKAKSLTIKESIINGALPNINEKRKLIDPKFEKISKNGCDFVENLLIKDPVQRLGSSKNPQRIKNHAFFSSINWTHLENGEIEAPIKPDVIFLFLYDSKSIILFL